MLRCDWNKEKRVVPSADGDLQQHRKHPGLAVAKAGNVAAAPALVRNLTSKAALRQLHDLLQVRLNPSKLPKKHLKSPTASWFMKNL
jgi:hypothetical protein